MHARRRGGEGTGESRGYAVLCCAVLCSQLVLLCDGRGRGLACLPRNSIHNPHVLALAIMKPCVCAAYTHPERESIEEGSHRRAIRCREPSAKCRCSECNPFRAIPFRPS